MNVKKIIDDVLNEITAMPTEAPVKPDTKPDVKPKDPSTKPKRRTPYRDPDPGIHPNPDAKKEQNRKWLGKRIAKYKHKHNIPQ
jgi:hypothetical protein